MTAWQRLLRLRQPTEPGYPPTVITVYLDDHDGLVMFIDEGDGSKVTGIPLSDDECQKLSEVLQTKEPA